jgi:hypothetical protein
MTMRQTIEIPANRKVHFDLVVPESVPCGKRDVILDFPLEPEIRQTNVRNLHDDWRSLYGFCKNSGDTLDAFMERHHEDGRLELENEESERR